LKGKEKETTEKTKVIAQKKERKRKEGGEN
jgi:hypothetical protein